MTKRTITKNANTISLPFPDGRIYDFTKTADQAPYAVQISVPPQSTFEGVIPYWNENFQVLLTCIAGRVHTSWGTGYYSNVDSFFGAGSSETYNRFTLHYWQRPDQWQTSHPASTSHRRKMGDEAEPLLDINRDVEKGINQEAVPDLQDILTVAIFPGPDYWDQRYHRHHELLYRNWASIELDAPFYPIFPTTPLPIRLLFSLPRFLFPTLLRNWLIAYFLSIQLLVLFSAFNYHPDFGSWPLMWLCALVKFDKYFILPPRFPEWVCRCQWSSMVFVSHWKVWVWKGIGKRVLGMEAVYEEYTPERLKDVLDEPFGVDCEVSM